MLTCKYCITFATCRSQLRRMEIINKINRSLRYCPHVTKSVLTDTPVCEEFQPYKYFYCDEFHCFQHVLVCIKQPRGCPTNCSQRRDLINMARGRDLEVYFGLKEPSHNKLRRT